MADEKNEKKPNGKDDKAPTAPKPLSKDPFVEIVSLLFVLFIVASLINGIVTRINSSGILSHGWSGFNSRAILISHTKPVLSLENPIGVRVINLGQTNVYSAPAGKKIGTQKFRIRGKVLQGPVTVGNEKYWYVDYPTDPDGWVNDSEIAYLVDELNIVERIIIFVLSFVSFLKIVLIIFSLVMVIFMIHLIRKLTALRMNEKKLLYPKGPEIVEAKNPQWQGILDHLESPNENDWRLAILEADIMLSDLLDKFHLPGETVADKLKAVERSDFLTLDDAWEAHKIRNQIAHDGKAFLLNQHEARRVIDLYRSVFEEFKII